MEFSESEKENQEELPATLDVVKIDGRWAQVVGSRDGDKRFVIKFLDNEKIDDVDLAEYDLTRRFDMVVSRLKEFCGEELPKEQAKKVHWGPEQVENPELRGLVTVFGEYKKPS
ncbi:MAG: hypothetical protein LiPW15_26 [Parcubacteria group bacterium LiPW_15]|nr:MAG: hypothetical protein LiPW15_26 [Parcubacteria group bacterium LiPW_15]